MDRQTGGRTDVPAVGVPGGGIAEAEEPVVDKRKQQRRLPAAITQVNHLL